ncbi:MAG: Abi family protein, partial [Ruthenibacterium sp.]
MKDLKLHASLLEQVSKLRTRGLIIDNETFAETLLSNANYYRLTGYLHNFKDSESDKYCDGITIERLKRIYEFDRKLTRILMYALEDVEETFKTRLSYTITQQYPNDPLIYLKPNIYRDYAQYISFLAHFYETVDKNKDIPFVKHHKDNYGGNFPMWVAVELFTMGNLCAIYENLQANHQKKIAKTYNTGSQQMKSWIENLKDTRNHLAHY